MRMIRFFSTVIYGVATFMLIELPWLFVLGWFSWIAEWWGVVTSSYLVLQLIPVALLLAFRPFNKNTWKWDWGNYDAWSSYGLAAVILLAGLLYWLSSQDMFYAQYKIFWMAFVASIADILIAYIEHKLGDIAPAGPAPAQPAAHGAAGHHP